tara:strand:+ start:431 stop:775 length:345 start_codon:yes stop_codon:yes gene_type:complete
MSDFFQSELVRGDIQQMIELQQFCFRSAMNFSLLDDERKLEYFDALSTLIEKQKVFHYRIKLSDDPEAQSVLETMKQGIVMLGASPDTSIESMFDELLNKVHVMRTKLESGTKD